MTQAGLQISQATLQGYFDNQKAQADAVIAFFKDMMSSTVPLVMAAISMKERECASRIEVAKLELERAKLENPSAKRRTSSDVS
jgi:hypothetical protein